MPLYEYVCPECGHKFEMLKSLSRRDEDTACPKCSHSAERVLSTFACFSKGKSGISNSIGGSSCSSCGGNTCSSCGP